MQVFYVRKGRVMGRRGFLIDKVEDLAGPELVAKMLERLYFDDNPMGDPKTVLVPELPEAQGLYEDWLSEMRGSQVEIRVPQRGEKRALLETVTRNAAEEFTRHRLKRASDHNSRSRALNELQQYLGLPEAPLRIECYDMSHIQGTDYVGSMVVVEDGLPKKSDYRRFKIRTVDGNDDFARHGGGADPPVLGLPRGSPPADRGAVGEVLVPAAAAGGRRRQGSARCGRAGARRAGPARRRSRCARWPSSSRRCSCPVRASRCGCPGSARRCTCCSASATRATASPSPTTASCATSA